MKLGAHILQSAAPFGKYFSELLPGQANVYGTFYTLLHTYAHTLMKAIAEFSGLDMGEHGVSTCSQQTWRSWSIAMEPRWTSETFQLSGATTTRSFLSTFWRQERSCVAQEVVR